MTAHGRSFFEEADGRSWTLGGSWMDDGWAMGGCQPTFEDAGKNC